MKTSEPGKNVKSRENLLFLTLFLSGFAGLVNQVVWQRSIKIYLGGADAISSMIVVLVFMTGLGLGSLVIGKKASSLKNPIRSLAKIEAALFVVNILVLLLLQIDMSDSIFAFQRAAISLGVPIKLLYALTGIGLLIIPCSLMGMTMPVASEGAHRQLQFANSWLVDHMFFINTAGAFFGAVLTGLKLLPFYGQTFCLIIAAMLNLSAALLLLTLRTSETEKAAAAADDSPHGSNDTRQFSRWWHFRDEETATFFLGFVSLGYEMYLFRVIPLVSEPLPHTFALILSFYLLAWAFGVLLSGHLKDVVLPTIIIGALTVSFTPFSIMYDRLVAPDLSITLGTISYYIPCAIFGILFGQLLNRFIKNWGADVGKFMGLNTIGSCLGVVATTMIGGNIYHAFNAWIFAAIMLGVGIWLFLRNSETARANKYCIPGSIAVTAAVLSLLVINGSVAPHTNKQYTTYSDPVGITEITPEGDMIWDGLWHSALSNGRSHIGSHNWMIAVIPVLCAPDATIDNAMIVGLGTGITAGTLAKSSQIKKIRSYEINRSIELIMREYPKQTLGILTNPKSEIIWQDARTGMALDEKKFQLISQQPLYLMQAGSSNLLSEEYLRLVSKRLTDNGIFLVYANSKGNQAQKMVVRKTLENIFPYCMSFMKGYTYIVSRSPIIFTRESIERKLAADDDELIKEIKARMTIDEIMKLQDAPDDSWKKCPITVKDNFPILEYSSELTELSRSW